MSTRLRMASSLVAAAALAVLLAAVCMMGFSPEKAYAGVAFSDDNTWVVAPSEDDNVHSSHYIDFIDTETGLYTWDVTIANLKSSNKKVAKVSKSDGSIRIDYGVKVGKTTISGTVNGVPFKHVFKVKYTCPAKTFKIGGKSVLKKFKKKNLYVVKKSIKKKKVAVKTKKNWVITKVDICTKGRYKSKELNNKKKYSTKLTTVFPYDGILLTFKNTKTGEEQTMKYRKDYDSTYRPQAG